MYSASNMVSASNSFEIASFVISAGAFSSISAKGDPLFIAVDTTHMLEELPVRRRTSWNSMRCHLAH